MEAQFAEVPMHLYAALALAATLASLIASNLREPEMWGTVMRLLMTFGTCLLLLSAWGHLSFVLISARDAAREDDVAGHLNAHLLIVAAMLPLACTTILRSWRSGVKKSVQLQGWT